MIYDCVKIFQLSSQIWCYFYYLTGQERIWKRYLLNFLILIIFQKNNTLLCFVASHKDYDLLKQLNHSLSTKRTIQDYKLYSFTIYWSHFQMEILNSLQIVQMDETFATTKKRWTKKNFEKLIFKTLLWTLGLTLQKIQQNFVSTRHFAIRI